MTDFAKQRRKAIARYERLMGMRGIGLPETCVACGQRIEDWEPLSVVELQPIPLVVHHECKAVVMGWRRKQSVRNSDHTRG